MAGNVLEFTDANWKSEVLRIRGAGRRRLLGTPGAAPAVSSPPPSPSSPDEFHGKVKIGKMDTDQNAATPPTLRISGIPAVVFFHGGKEVDRIVGLQPEAKYKAPWTPRRDGLTTRGLPTISG